MLGLDWEEEISKAQAQLVSIWIRNGMILKEGANLYNCTIVANCTNLYN